MINEFTKDEYLIRAVTAPFKGYHHKVGECSIKCALGTENFDCPACKILCKPQPYWLIGCIDKNLNDYVVYKMDIHIFSQIRKFAIDPDWGNPENYDLQFELGSIYTDKDARYTIYGKRRPATESDFRIKSKADTTFLKEQCCPPPIDYFNNFEERFKSKLCLLL